MPPPSDDERTLARLAEAVAALDPIPRRVFTDARAAYALRQQGTEIADLIEDTAMSQPSGLRAAAPASGPRCLDFRGGGVSVHLEATVYEDRVEIAGQVTPADVESVRVRWPDGAADVPTARGGAFAALSPPGPVSVVLRRRGTVPVATSWIYL